MAVEIISVVASKGGGEVNAKWYDRNLELLEIIVYNCQISSNWTLKVFTFYFVYLISQ